jgi:hypothetical protein
MLFIGLHALTVNLEVLLLYGRLQKYQIKLTSEFITVFAFAVPVVLQIFGDSP